MLESEIWAHTNIVRPRMTGLTPETLGILYMMCSYMYMHDVESNILYCVWWWVTMSDPTFLKLKNTCEYLMFKMWCKSNCVKDLYKNSPYIIIGIEMIDIYVYLQ